MKENIKNALIIFARKPELGKVKTRLAATIGNNKALDIYTKLLMHTRSVVKEANAETFIFLTEPTQDNFWEPFSCELQIGNSLGERIQHAFEFIFKKNFYKCIIIGSDCPELSEEIVNSAFNKLETHDAVIGEAQDGGYYLLGTKHLIPALFKNKEWSTANVFSQTILDFKNEKLSYSTLPVLNDLDEEKDIPPEWL